jgi:hypothetical protein
MGAGWNAALRSGYRAADDIAEDFSLAVRTAAV